MGANAADAYVFVTPQYNFGPPPSFLNALNYVYKEWNYKPAGMVSYGGVSEGVRSALVEKLTLTTLKIMPMVEAVAIPNISAQFDDMENFMPDDHHVRSGNALLTERALQIGRSAENDAAINSTKQIPIESPISIFNWLSSFRARIGRSEDGS